MLMIILKMARGFHRNRLERGDARRAFGDGNSGGAPMYSCVGVQALRFGGVVECSPCFASLSNEHWRTIIEMAKRAESALEYCPSVSQFH
jgi:hypothetical protein